MITDYLGWFKLKGRIFFTLEDEKIKQGKIMHYYIYNGNRIDCKDDDEFMQYCERMEKLGAFE